MTTADEYKAGKTAGIIAATCTQCEHNHTSRDEARNRAAKTGWPIAETLDPERRRQDRAFWLGYLRGVRQWDEVLREDWQQLRRDGSCRMTFEQYRDCTSPVR